MGYRDVLRLVVRRSAAPAVLLLMMPALAACGAGASNDTYSLSLAAPVEAASSARNRQILVTEPTALKALDSEQVVIRLSESEIQYLSKSQWSDRLPKLVQARLVQAFENTGKVGGVGKPGEGLAIDFQVITEIRAFEVAAGSGNRATVELFVKILNDRNGTVIAQKLFNAQMPVSGSGNERYIAAMDAAFSSVSSEIVEWTLGVI